MSSSSRLTSASDRIVIPSLDGSELGDSLSSSSSHDSRNTFLKRRRQRQRQRQRFETRFATVISITSLLIWLATVVLVMWLTGDIGQKVQQLWRQVQPSFSSSSLSPPAAPVMAPPQSQALVRRILVHLDSDGESDLAKSGGSASDEAPGTTVTSQSTIGCMSSSPPLPLPPSKPRGYECWSEAIDGSKVLYPYLTNVTKWKTSERLSSQCPIISSDSAELRIEEDGDYFLYSQAWFSGVMTKGVVLQKVGSENTERSLRIRHSIVCWQNCDGSRDRISGAVRLRDADITALDVLNTYVALQLRLRRGAMLGVMVTSPNGTGVHEGAWTKVVLGLIRLS